MSQSCSNCGGDITPGARFCRFCGAKMEPLRPEPRSSAPSTYEPIPSRAAPSEPVRPSIVEPAEVEAPVDLEVPEDIILILYSRKRKDEIDGELRLCLTEMQQLEQKLEIGLLDSDEASNSLNDAKTKIVDLKKEKEKLVSRPLRLENLLEDVTKWEERLSKLEDMRASGKIDSEGVYTKLRGEYSEKTSAIRQEIQAEVSRAKGWLHTLERDTKTLEEELEGIKVRMELGEVSAEEATDKESSMKKDFKKKSAALKSLKEILRSI